MSKLSKILFIAPLLAACGQTDAKPTPEPSAVVTPDLSTELARPQPELPICAHCGADLGAWALPNDDELSMIVNSVYKGDIEDVFLVVYTANTKHHVYFDQSVIDDLNDLQIYETIVMLDVPNMQRGLLVFTLESETGEFYEPVTVE